MPFESAPLRVVSRLTSHSRLNPDFLYTSPNSQSMPHDISSSVQPQGGHDFPHATPSPHITSTFPRFTPNLEDDFNGDVTVASCSAPTSSHAYDLTDDQARNEDSRLVPFPSIELSHGNCTLPSNTHSSNVFVPVNIVASSNENVT
ncbi:hypothetical protein V6N13_106848 [Hibiscus sabdariffa]|uniref:Uncharacterized protein n=1 Tax=Hibiscus sabdariffa TaxID=183260 RepID=A0ABR2F1Z0_9ROSI